MPETPHQSDPPPPAFTACVPAAEGAAFERHDTPEDLARALAGTTAPGLIVYAAPIGAIARLLQEEGADPATAPERWRDMARPWLALARRLRRRLILCQAPESDAAEAELHEILAERFPGTPLPGPAARATAPDPFFTALAALRATRDAQTFDMVQTLQARSSGPVLPVAPFDAAAAVLLERWQTLHRESGEEAALLTDQIAGLERDLSRLNDDHDKALADQFAQARDLVAQIDANTQAVESLTAERDAAKQALATERERIAALQAVEADLNDRLQGKNKQIGALTAERDVARANHDALKDRAEREEQRLKEALAEQTAAHEAETNRLSGEKQALEEAAADDRDMLTHMGEQIAELESALRIARAQEGLSEAQKRSVLSEGRSLETVLEETARLVQAAERERERKSEGREALRHVVRQLETALAMLQKRQGGALRALSSENDALKAEVEALRSSTSWRVTRPMRSVSRLVRH